MTPEKSFWIYSHNGSCYRVADERSLLCYMHQEKSWATYGIQFKGGRLLTIPYSVRTLSQMEIV